MSLIFSILALLPQLEPLPLDDAPIAIDGRLDEPAWARAAVSDRFTQDLPDPGAPPREPTRVRALYDERNLYFGIECEQATSPSTRRLTRRDREVNSDWVSVELATRGDGTTAYHFQVSSAGVLIDGVRYDDVEYSGAWDENWEASARVGRDRWWAEIRIPLRILRFEHRTEQTWGFEVRRWTAARQELDEWVWVPRTGAGEVSRYGRIGPFQGLEPDGGLELRPFAVASATHRGGAQEIAAPGWQREGAVGLDAKWHLTEELTLDLALAPDFGQVEADEVVLNLDNFETQYPEKRPFFLEGLDVLQTPVQLLYTRRIGAAPEEPALREGERLREVTAPARILGAGKLVGRIAPSLSFGALAALTAPEELDVEDARGQRAPRLVDPWTTFGLVRLKRELGGHGHLGLSAASTLRLEAEHPHGEVCPNGVEVAAGGDCFRDALVASADGLFRSGDWTVQAQVVGSAVRGGTSETLDDGTVVQSGDVSSGAWLQLAKAGGEHWLGSVLVESYGREMVLDDLGYLPRQNWRHVFAVGTYRVAEPFGPFVLGDANLELFAHTNTDWLRGPSGIQLNGSGKLRNGLFGFVEVHYRPAWFDDREVGDGTALERQGLVGLELYGETDSSAPLSLEVEGVLKGRASGWLAEGAVRLTVRAIAPLDVTVGISGLETDGEPRWLEPGGAAGMHRLGRQHAQELATLLRATWTFTPRLTLQVYGQLFLAAVHYHDFLETDRPTRRIELDALHEASAPESSPDDQEAQLHLSVVLRWEWSLGATLLLVYTRAAEAEPALELDDRPLLLDTASLGRGPTSDVLLAKLSWWWG